MQGLLVNFEDIIELGMIVFSNSNKMQLRENLKNQKNQKMKKTKSGLKSKALVIFGTLLFVIFINDLSEKLALNPKQFNGGTS